MFGLYSAKPSPATASKNHDGSGGFDPTGLERAAKAAREIDTSTNVKTHRVAEIILRTGLPRV